MGKLAPWLVGAGLGLLAGWFLFGRGKPPVVSPHTIAVEDTLARTRAAFDSVQRSAAAYRTSASVRLASDSVRLAARDRSAQVHHAAVDTALAHHDTATALTERTAEAFDLRIAFDAAKYDLHLAHRALELDSLAARDAAVRDRQQSDAIDGLNFTIDHARQPSRWSLGITGGYGLVLSGGRIYTGPGATAGLSRSFRLPCIFHCGSAP